jgi:hypothetical protein
MARITVRAILLSGLLASLGPAARAQEPEIRFTVRPANPPTSDIRSNAWLIHRLKPGDIARDAVIVENLGDVPLELDLYSADGVTTALGEFTLQPEEAPDVGVAQWTTVGRSRVSLDPEERVRVPIVIRVPRNATPGDHPGGVVARTVEPVKRGQVRTLLAVGARVYLRVPGEIVHDLWVHEVRPEVNDGHVRFLLDLENAGNTLLDVSAAYELAGLLGLDRTEREVALVATLVPGARATVVVEHRATLLGGPYSADFQLRFGGDGVVSAGTSFFVFPPWPLLVAAALIPVTLVGLLLRRTRRVRAHAAAHHAAAA